MFHLSVARGKHSAAADVFDMIPSDARESIIAQWQEQVHLTDIYPTYIMYIFHHRNYHMMYPMLFKSIYASKLIL